MKNNVLVLGLVLACGTGAAAQQHSSFVLFGEPAAGSASSPAEHRHVHGITAPYYNEDSFVTTDLRLWYAYHDFPNFGALGGGQGHVAALQVRVAITSWLQLVAYKDGYLWLDTGLIEEDGWNDIGAGLKFNFWQDFENQFHAAAGVGYEFPWGDANVLQNDANLRPWISVDKGFDRLHFGVTGNLLIETGDDDALGNSDRFFWNFRADYRLTDWFSPVININGYHALEDDDEVVPFSGVDLIQLGGGDDVVTFGVGGEFRPLSDQQLGVRFAYETPLSSGDDLYGFRWTFSLVWGF